MKTQPSVVKQERVDDIPVILGLMVRIRLGEIVDKHLGRHHLHRGLSCGQLAVGWLSYVLSASDHRKSAVQDWANKHSRVLESFFACPLRPHEFNDDRLGLLLSRLAGTDWDALES